MNSNKLNLEEMLKLSEKVEVWFKSSSNFGHLKKNVYSGYAGLLNVSLIEKNHYSKTEKSKDIVKSEYFIRVRLSNQIEIGYEESDDVKKHVDNCRRFLKQKDSLKANLIDEGLKYARDIISK